MFCFPIFLQSPPNQHSKTDSTILERAYQDYLKRPSKQTYQLSTPDYSVNFEQMKQSVPGQVSLNVRRRPKPYVPVSDEKFKSNEGSTNAAASSRENVPGSKKENMSHDRLKSAPEKKAKNMQQKSNEIPSRAASSTSERNQSSKTNSTSEEKKKQVPGRQTKMVPQKTTQIPGKVAATSSENTLGSTTNSNLDSKTKTAPERKTNTIQKSEVNTQKKKLDAKSKDIPSVPKERTDTSNGKSHPSGTNQSTSAKEKISKGQGKIKPTTSEERTSTYVSPKTSSGIPSKSDAVKSSDEGEERRQEDAVSASITDRAYLNQLLDQKIQHQILKKIQEDGPQKELESASIEESYLNQLLNQKIQDQIWKMQEAAHDQFAPNMEQTDIKPEPAKSVISPEQTEHLESKSTKSAEMSGKSEHKQPQSMKSKATSNLENSPLETPKQQQQERVAGATAVASCLWSDEKPHEICVDQLRGKCKLGYGCKQLHGKFPFQWQYWTNQHVGWGNFGDETNEVIEKLFSEPSKTQVVVNAR